jgi:hypothetical protein
MEGDDLATRHSANAVVLPPKGGSTLGSSASILGLLRNNMLGQGVVVLGPRERCPCVDSQRDELIPERQADLMTEGMGSCFWAKAINRVASAA